MNLEKLNNKYTDKNTIHSYFPIYNTLFSKIRLEIKTILEIGIDTGGSIKLWCDYFPNATIFGCDILDNIKIHQILYNNRVKLKIGNCAYTQKFVKNNFIDNNIKFDIILDDGPHTLDSMQKFLQLYSPLLNNNGILIIEDVQSISWLKTLKQSTPKDLKQYIETHDLRHIKDRYDDILFIINKRLMI